MCLPAVVCPSTPAAHLPPRAPLCAGHLCGRHLHPLLHARRAARGGQEVPRLAGAHHWAQPRRWACAWGAGPRCPGPACTAKRARRRLALAPACMAAVLQGSAQPCLARRHACRRRGGAAHAAAAGHGHAAAGAGPAAVHHNGDRCGAGACSSAAKLACFMRLLWLKLCALVPFQPGSLCLPARIQRHEPRRLPPAPCSRRDEPAAGGGMQRLCHFGHPGVSLQALPCVFGWGGEAPAGGRWRRGEAD